jgi:hippurate hydrolase
MEEFNTSVYVAAKLGELGIETATGIGGTGVVGRLSKGTSQRAIGLRADMDGLPIDEQTGFEWASTNGRMHACGHDGHMAMVLGAAHYLSKIGKFNGSVNFLFQPAEEHGLGAKAMLKDGLLEKFPMQSIYGIHNLPGVEQGTISTRPGPLMASEDNFIIEISGRGGHAARPQAVVDPIVIGAEIVTALQSIVGRNVDPAKSAVISCTEFITDGARNAIPSNVTIKGDTRSFDYDIQELLESRMRTLVENICAAHGAVGKLTYTHEFEPTINDSACTEIAVTAATTAIGKDKVNAMCDIWLASEDFGAFLQAIPGCFVFLGNGLEGNRGGVPLHSRDYEFNDDSLEVGILFYVNLIESQLA